MFIIFRNAVLTRYGKALWGMQQHLYVTPQLTAITQTAWFPSTSETYPIIVPVLKKCRDWRPSHLAVEEPWVHSPALEHPDKCISQYLSAENDLFKESLVHISKQTKHTYSILWGNVHRIRFFQVIWSVTFASNRIFQKKKKTKQKIL